jgi:fatty acid desaturase|eukprot:TRINITY_DN2143_c0_g1_i1.p1 TRINITY_DN2143_c0_g1~~TRINITY_DN2143_c0_g1_i1.p1  ORF type:complete len:372 (+),score=113.64 TRINITY_DN2143_c0_g1_i1:54-1118(+)
MQRTSVQSKDHPELKKKNPYQAKVNSIRKVIFAEDKRLREKYQWLQYQDEIGMAWFVFSCIIMFGTAYLYLVGSLAWYWTVLLLSFSASILHELEHDLIHDLYFKKLPWVQHVMFAFIWLSKMNANPWWRKAYHLKHHKVSGQVTDVEERLIGLGLPLGIKRFLITVTPLCTLLVIFDIARDSFKHNSKPFLNVVHTYAINLPGILPAQIPFFLLVAGYVFPSLFSEATMGHIMTACVLTFFPNTFRQVCLQVISTSVHYYGDIPEKNVFFQNQILNHWICWPLQAFCFNFGETHIIHHYVTRQPFYLRQMASGPILQEMKAQGVPVNDFDILKRANRFYDHSNENSKPQAVAS